MSFPTGPTGDYSSSPGMTSTEGLNDFSSKISPSFETSAFSIQGLETGDMQILNGFNVANTVLIIVGVFLFSLLILMTYVTSVFQFVMYKSMIDEVKLGYATDFLKEGFQYLVFRWVTTIAVLLMIILGVGIGSALNLSLNAFGVVTGLVLGLIILSTIIAVSILRWLAFNFALPEMIRNDSGLIKALKTSYRVAKSEFREVAIFWLMKLIIGIGLGVAAFSIMFPVFILLLIPFGIVGFLLTMLSPVFLLPIIVIYLITVVLAGMIVAVPIRVYVYNYILEMHEDLF